MNELVKRCEGKRIWQFKNRTTRCKTTAAFNKRVYKMVVLFKQSTTHAIHLLLVMLSSILEWCCKSWNGRPNKVKSSIHSSLLLQPFPMCINVHVTHNKHLLNASYGIERSSDSEVFKCDAGVRSFFFRISQKLWLLFLWAMFFMISYFAFWIYRRITSGGF